MTTTHDTSTPPQRATGRDRARQLTVTGSEILCVVGTLYGVGLLGTRVEESSGGALSAEATRIAPATRSISSRPRWTPALGS